MNKIKKILLTTVFLVVSSVNTYACGPWGAPHKYYLSVKQIGGQSLNVLRVKVEAQMIYPPPNNRRVEKYALIARSREWNHKKKAIALEGFENLNEVKRLMQVWPHYYNTKGKLIYLPVYDIIDSCR